MLYIALKLFKTSGSAGLYPKYINDQIERTARYQENFKKNY